MAPEPAPKWSRTRLLYLALGIVVCAFGIYLIAGPH
jgi:hypothetical protein